MRGHFPYFFVDFDGAKALASAERYPLHEPLPESFLQESCFKVVEGIDRVCAWMED